MIRMGSRSSGGYTREFKRAPDSLAKYKAILEGQVPSVILVLCTIDGLVMQYQEELRGRSGY